MSINRSALSSGAMKRESAEKKKKKKKVTEETAWLTTQKPEQRR